MFIYCCTDILFHYSYASEVNGRYVQYISLPNLYYCMALSYRSFVLIAQRKLDYEVRNMLDQQAI